MAQRSYICPMVTLLVFCARKSSLQDTQETPLLSYVLFCVLRHNFWLDTKSGPLFFLSLLGWGLQRDASLRAPASNQATRTTEHTSGL